MNLRNAISNAWKSSLAFAIILSGALMPSTQVQAVSGDGLIAYPATSDPSNPLTESWFIYNLGRGENKEDSLVIKNDSDQPQSLSIYAVDSTVNNLGDFALEGENESKDSMGKWITLETNRLEMAPHEEKQVKFSIAIPDDAQSGENNGGIVIQKDLTQAQKETKSGFVISTRIGIRVYETVPGEMIYKADFGEPSIAYNEKDRVYVLTMPVKNGSNSSIETTVRIHVKDMLLGRQNKALEKTMRIPREEEAKFVFTLDEAQIGQFEVTSELTYKKNDGKTETIPGPRTGFWAFPWQYLPIIELLLLANAIFFILLKLLKRRDRKYRKSYLVQNGDNLENLSERLQTSWKKIAKMNKLKAPYQLEVGQEIIVIDRHDVLDSPRQRPEVLSEPDENALLHKQEAFEKDMNLIANKGGSESKKDRFRKIRKIIAFMIMVSIIGGIGYAIISRFPAGNNQADFVYDRGSEFPVDADTEDTTAKEGSDPQSADRDQETTTAPQPEVTQEKESPEITAEDRATIKIEILNGNGIKGVSSQAASLLKAQGYTSITTGNADRFDYAQTVITCSNDVRNELCQEVRSIIATKYSSIEDRESDDSSTGGIVIILGK